MKIPELRWPIGSGDYDDDLLLEISAVSVVLLIRGRNAWHGTWVRHYLRNSTLYTDVESAMAGAESQRGPGNVFYILDIPALQLRGTSANVILCDAHPDDCFGAFVGVSARTHRSAYGAWIDGVYPGVSTRDAVSAFSNSSGLWSGPVPNEHSLRSGGLPLDIEIPRAKWRGRSLVSRPIGSHRDLQWDVNERSNRYSSSGAKTVAKQWKTLFDEVVASGGGDDSAICAQLHHYRDRELEALPYSQWVMRKERILSERRDLRQSAHQAWSQAHDRTADLEEELEEAEFELDQAKSARFPPADSSSGIRAQRLRVDTAVAAVARLRSEIEIAEAQERDLHTKYRDAISSELQS